MILTSERYVNNVKYFEQVKELVERHYPGQWAAFHDNCFLIAPTERDLHILLQDEPGNGFVYITQIIPRAH